MIGMGVLIERLSGYGGTSEAVQASLGKKIRSVKMVGDDLLIDHEGGELRVSDNGQSCCESRYMSCDDDLSGYEGATLLDITVEDGPPGPAEYDYHETQFLHVKTSKGSFTCQTHVEHNGYYGGFAICARLTPVQEVNTGAEL